MNNKKQLIKREERYIVVKLKHLDDEHIGELRSHLENWQIPTQECVVVESDWPNYEMVWESIQRISDATYSDPYAEIEQLRKELDIKIADAIEAAAKAIQHDQVNYDGTDATVFHIDELLDYAEMIRNGN